MNQEKYVDKMPQNLTLEDRRHLALSGVEDIDVFGEDLVRLRTVLGELTIHGSGLKMGRFNVETGELNLDGNIVALCYADDRNRRNGFLGRVFG